LIYRDKSYWIHVSQLPLKVKKRPKWVSFFVPESQTIIVQFAFDL
jgi:hypothetical protein